MFKEEITAAFGIINSVPAMKWVDEDFGQIDQYEGDRPPVAFPCALISINTQGEHQAGDIYSLTHQLSVRVAHNRIGDRSGKASAEAVALTMAKLDDVEAIKDAFIAAGYYFTTMITERRTDGIAVHQLSFNKFN